MSVHDVPPTHCITVEDRTFGIAGPRVWNGLPPDVTISLSLSQEITQPVRWPLFSHRRANAVEQSAWTAAATGHHLWTIQTIVENVYVWL